MVIKIMSFVGAVCFCAKQSMQGRQFCHGAAPEEWIVAVDGRRCLCCAQDLFYKSIP